MLSAPDVAWHLHALHQLSPRNKNDTQDVPYTAVLGLALPPSHLWGIESASAAFIASRVRLRCDAALVQALVGHAWDTRTETGRRQVQQVRECSGRQSVSGRLGMRLTASRRMSSGRTGLASQSSPPGVGLPRGSAPRSCASWQKVSLPLCTKLVLWDYLLACVAVLRKPWPQQPICMQLQDTSLAARTGYLTLWQSVSGHL